MNYKILLFLIVALSWGGSFISIKFVLEEYPPIFSAMLRVFVGMFSLLVFYTLTGKKISVLGKEILPVYTCGLLLQGIPFLLIFLGEQNVSAGVSGIFMGTIPIWTVVFSIFLLKNNESLTLQKFCGILAGMMGIFLIFYQKATLSNNQDELISLLYLGLAVISYGIGTALNKKIILKIRTLDIYANLFQQHIVSFIFLLIVSFFFESWNSFSSKIPSITTVTSVLYLGIFANAVAWMIYFYLTKSWGAVRTSTITYLVPLVSLLLDFIIKKRVPTLLEVTGVLVIFSGIFLIQKRIIFFPEQNSKVSGS